MVCLAVIGGSCYMKMANFINFEADVEGDYVEEVDFVNSEHDDEVSNISDSDSLKSFIDNEEIKTDVNFYCYFNNIEIDIKQTLKMHIKKPFMMLKNLMKYQIYVRVLKKNLKLKILKIPNKI